MDEDPTDDELTAHAVRGGQGGRPAFHQLVERHGRPTAAWLLRQLAPADAADLLVDILLKAWRGGHTFRGGTYRAWLFGIARSELADFTRRFRIADLKPTSHAAAVADGLSRLTEQQRALLRARFGGVEDLPATCARLGIDREKASTLVGTGLAGLREGRTRFRFSTMPADRAELADWLERQVAGPDLGLLIAELSALHDPVGAAPDLSSVLGAEQSAVLAGGLSTLAEDGLRTLLRHPVLLAELQDAVAERGGAAWDELFDHATLARVVQRAWQDVTASKPARRPRRLYRRPWFVALATAVTILLTVFLNHPPGPPSWGWGRPGALERGDTRDRRLAALTNAAEQWHGRPRGTTAELRRTLKEMRDGFTALLAASQPPLSADDRTWLMDRCMVWGGKFDRHLADLQSGRPVDEVRREADETVDGLVLELKTRVGE